MAIQEEIQSLSPSAIIELFELDATALGGTVIRFHCGTNELKGSVIWQGYAYSPLPIEAEGFDIQTRGSLPRPKIRLANTAGLFSYEISAYDDLVGCKVTRKRTLAKYLDAANFASGNPTADPNQKFSDDIWYVEQKVSENKHLIEWELASPFDLMGVLLPYRQIIQNSCPWKYRSSECGYTGTVYFDGNDNSVASAAQDSCGKRLTSCKKRFTTGTLPFGGFPGVIQY